MIWHLGERGSLGTLQTPFVQGTQACWGSCNVRAGSRSGETSVLRLGASSVSPDPGVATSVPFPGPRSREGRHSGRRAVQHAGWKCECRALTGDAPEAGGCWLGGGGRFFRGPSGSWGFGLSFLSEPPWLGSGLEEGVLASADTAPWGPELTPEGRGPRTEASGGNGRPSRMRPGRFSEDSADVTEAWWEGEWGSRHGLTCAGKGCVRGRGLGGRRAWGREGAAFPRGLLITWDAEEGSHCRPVSGREVGAEPASPAEGGVGRGHPPCKALPAPTGPCAGSLRLDRASGCQESGAGGSNGSR